MELKYTIKKISELENISQKIIRKEIASQNLYSEKINGKYLITESDYKNWIKTYSSQNKEENLSEKKLVNFSTQVHWTDISEDFKKDGWTTNYQNGFTFIDLFSGAGGLSCGLVMAGFKPLASVEINKFAVETYKYNFLQKKGYKENITDKDIREKKVKEELYDTIKNKEVDLIVGGFPCQGFSMAGNRIVEDERNSLYLEMLEIVKNIKPKCVVMENVEGIKTMLNGKILEKILSDYKKIGYNISVQTLNAADYNVPQIRKRVIFIGNRINIENLHPAPLLSKDKYKTVGMAIKKYINLEENKEINHIFTKHKKEMVERLNNLNEGESLYKNYSDSWKKSFWNQPSCTIKENHGGVNIHPKLPRVLTPRELAELQSFPEDFIFKGSKKWQLVQIGNAVPPLLGKAIGISVMKMLKGVKNAVDKK